MLDIKVKPATTQASMVLTAILRTYITLVLPGLLALISVRLVMTPAFLYFEYMRPDFPDDPYGLTREDRLRYAPYAIDYLLNGEGITYLSNLRFADGSSIFNVRELQHMRDVKTVTQAAYVGTVIAAGGAALAAYKLGQNRSTSRDLRMALFNGSVLTLGIIAVIALAAIVNWDLFFTSFHGLFFQSGTWRFAYSDILIRLFPEQFWFDAALVVGGVTMVSALAITYVMRRWKIPPVS